MGLPGAVRARNCIRAILQSTPVTEWGDVTVTSFYWALWLLNRQSVDTSDHVIYTSHMRC
jgi:hypothetical protein